jgi:regulator of replication initiation timing
MDVLSDEIRAKKDEVEGLKKEIREAIKEEAKEKNDTENFKKDLVAQKDKISKLNKKQTDAKN